MNNPSNPAIKDVGILTIRGVEWRLQEYYPDPTMHNYKILSAYNIETSTLERFASDRAFERWLDTQQAPRVSH